MLTMDRSCEARVLSRDMAASADFVWWRWLLYIYTSRDDGCTRCRGWLLSWAVVTDDSEFPLVGTNRWGGCYVNGSCRLSNRVDVPFTSDKWLSARRKASLTGRPSFMLLRSPNHCIRALMLSVGCIASLWYDDTESVNHLCRFSCTVPKRTVCLLVQHTLPVLVSWKLCACILSLCLLSQLNGVSISTVRISDTGYENGYRGLYRKNCTIPIKYSYPTPVMPGPSSPSPLVKEFVCQAWMSDRQMLSQIHRKLSRLFITLRRAYQKKHHTHNLAL